MSSQQQIINTLEAQNAILTQKLSRTKAELEEAKNLLKSTVGVFGELYNFDLEDPEHHGEMTAVGNFNATIERFLSNSMALSHHQQSEE